MWVPRVGVYALNFSQHVPCLLYFVSEGSFKTNWTGFSTCNLLLCSSSTNLGKFQGKGLIPHVCGFYYVYLWIEIHYVWDKADLVIICLFYTKRFEIHFLQDWLYIEQNKSTGELSFLTSLMNFAGSMGKLKSILFFSSRFKKICQFIQLFMLGSKSFHQHAGKGPNERYLTHSILIQVFFFMQSHPYFLTCLKSNELIFLTWCKTISCMNY